MGMSMVLLAWSRFLRQNGSRYIGGIMEFDDIHVGIIRGLISWIDAADGRLTISTHWSARQPKGAASDVWERYSPVAFEYLEEDISAPNVMDGDRVGFTSSFGERGILFPKHHSLVQEFKMP